MNTTLQHSVNETTMTEQEINIAIAEVCGWKDIRPSDKLVMVPIGSNPDPNEGYEAIPSYTTDLNAMHEAEVMLTDKQQNHYAWLLVQAVDNHMSWKPEEFVTLDIWEISLTEVWFACNTTALQRAEAFLRTLGKWKE